MKFAIDGQMKSSCQFIDPCIVRALALIFGTLKSLPANLPQTMAAHWIENGVVGKIKEVA